MDEGKERRGKARGVGIRNRSEKKEVFLEDVSVEVERKKEGQPRAVS